MPSLAVTNPARFAREAAVAWQERFRIQQLARAGKPVALVYTMGKVGSLAVLNVLRTHANAISVHFLSADGIRNAVEEHRRAGVTVPRHLLRAKALGAALEGIGNSVPLSVIALVRDPVAREVSDIFENLWRFHRDLDIARPDNALQYVRDSLLSLDPDSQYMGDWFKSELGGFLGFDVFQQPFDRSNGYVSSGPFRFGATVVIMTTEQLDVTLPRLVGEQFGKQINKPPPKVNTQGTGPNAALYEFVTQNLTLPDAILRRIYNSDIVRRFYNEEQRAAFARRWRG